MHSFAELAPEYERLWLSMTIRPDRATAVTAIARKLLAARSRYATVAARTSVPWFVIAALHERESGADFSTYLGNGEPFGRRTWLTPRGRGPFRTWEEGALDALALDGHDRVMAWTPARACYEIEKFNGFGYRVKATRSPYLWSFSNHYTRGTFVAGDRFNAGAVDMRCGAMPVIRRIMEFDVGTRFACERTTGTVAGDVPSRLPSSAQLIMQNGASLETIVATGAKALTNAAT